ncbi:MAG: CBS domain-containing protein [Thaumarchaeota archaeon]|nr:CBS domain-containing protein [Nitrososphaerota archaeon]
MIYVKDIMSAKVKTIGANASIRDAAVSMARWKIGALVISEGSTPVGIITEGDISRSVAKGEDPDTRLGTIGRKKLVTVPPAERVEVAAKIMTDSRLKKLPVMEDGKLVGIITQTDIVNSSFALVTSLKEMVQARYRPPDFEM